TAHQAHNATDLEASEDLAFPTVFRPSLTFTEGQVIDSVHLQVVRPVITGPAFVELLRRHVLDSRTSVVVSKVLSLGPRVGSPELRTGPTAREENLQAVIGGGPVRLDAIDVGGQAKLNGQRPACVTRSRRAGVDVDESHLVNRARANIAGLDR